RAGDTARVVLCDALRHDMRILRRIDGNNPPVVIDRNDDVAFLDFLRFAHPFGIRSVRDQIHAAYSRLSNHKDDASVRAKLEWLASYFNWKVHERVFPFAAERDFSVLDPNGDASCQP